MFMSFGSADNANERSGVALETNFYRMRQEFSTCAIASDHQPAN